MLRLAGISMSPFSEVLKDSNLAPPPPPPATMSGEPFPLVTNVPPLPPPGES